MSAINLATVGWLGGSLLAGLIGAALGAVAIQRRRRERIDP